VGKGVLAGEICWQTERENCRAKARELAKRRGDEVEKHGGKGRREVVKKREEGAGKRGGKEGNQHEEEAKR
jgi:hypothetical protein